MSDVVGEFTLGIEQVENYQFQVNFEKPEAPWLVIDEPPPLGKDSGPNPSRVFAAAMGSCLAMSLLFCLSKNKVAAKNMRAEVKVQSVRNDRKRLRIGRMEVVIHPGIADDDRGKAERCLGMFEDFCTVTASVREGIDIDVKVAGLEAPPEDEKQD